uniref:Transcription elongation factor n=1 Tax=Syphacia muris TaxID=451379 RepID=A0A0N5ASY5_9BILA
MDACENEVMRIGKKFERMIQGTKSMDSAMELLEALSSLPISIEILTKTRIGVILNDLRKKTNDERVSRRAKNLIKSWKNQLGSKDNKDGNKEKMPRNESTSSNLSEALNRSSPNVASVRQTSEATSYSTKVFFFKVRNKCILMLLNALRSGALPDGTLDPEDLAVRIEAKLHEVHRSTNEKYKAAVRSRVFNLRDKKNVALRENVLTGVVKPERFATMTSEDMASNEMRSMREKFTKDAINEHQMAVQEGTPSDMFKCGKCGKKNCTYNQMQTRSADEPMTTFVFCRECGNRWKFC